MIPDYAAIFLEAFEQLVNPQMKDTEIYIQNVYATLFSFQNDKRINLGMLKTALINTKKLNKALQDLLHNMDKFFGRLLKQQSYGDVLAEHLEGYVEEIVKKKYHMLKTNDNFYLYKMDIKKCLQEMREDAEWIERVRAKARAEGRDEKEDVLDILDAIERGFDDIEHRIANMDKEHSKYVRATVTRLNYMLSGEADMKGMVVSLLKHLEIDEKREERLSQVAEKMNLLRLEVLSEKSLFRRKKRRDFISRLEPDEDVQELTREEVLRLNKIHTRYSKKEIEEFLESHMKDGSMEMRDVDIGDDEAFEKLILAYDYCTRKNSRYQVIEREYKMLENGKYRYPDLLFVRRKT